MDVIQVKNLTFAYEEDVCVLQDVSFNIKQGSYTTIVGHNGSGKSTLAKLLVGLLEKKSGVIKVKDILLEEETLFDVRALVGVVFQNPDNQFIGSSVADDIAFGLENQQVDSDKMQSIVETFAQKVGMQNYLDNEPTRLSGGQKQRVAIAGVLAMNLEIIILDESTSMLDPKGKMEIKQLIRELHEKTNLTIVSITHDMDEVCQSDHVIVLKEGCVLKEGTPTQVLDDVEVLRESKLDLPKVIKLKELLCQEGIELSTQLTLEGVVEQICQLYLKK